MSEHRASHSFSPAESVCDGGSRQAGSLEVDGPPHYPPTPGPHSHTHAPEVVGLLHPQAGEWRWVPGTGGRSAEWSSQTAVGASGKSSRGLGRSRLSLLSTSGPTEGAGADPSLRGALLAPSSEGLGRRGDSHSAVWMRSPRLSGAESRPGSRRGWPPAPRPPATRTPRTSKGGSCPFHRCGNAGPEKHSPCPWGSRSGPPSRAVTSSPGDSSFLWPPWIRPQGDRRVLRGPFLAQGTVCTGDEAGSRPPFPCSPKRSPSTPRRCGAGEP